MASKQQSEHVVVVGGGIIGLCTAYALQQQGYHVSIIDPNHNANNASTASAGIIGGSAVVPWASSSLWSKVPAMYLNPNSPLTLSFPVPHNFLSFLYQSRRAGNPQRYRASAEGLADLGLSGYDNWMALLKDLDDARALFRQTGCYFVYLTQADRVNDELNNELRKEFGMQLEDLHSGQTAKALPPLVATDAGAVKVLKAGHVVDPLGLQQALRTAFQRRGGQLITSLVSHFDTNDSQVCKARTAEGEYDFDHIVIAAGSSSAILARKFGSNFPMIPGDGYSLKLIGANVHLDAPLLFMGQGIAVTPTRDGIRVAGLVSIGGSAKRSRERHYRQLLEFAKTLFTDLEYKSVEHNTGARPLTSDSLPVISRSPHFHNVWFNCGHGHWGLTQAASSAKVLVNLFEQDAQSNEANPFSASRF